MTGNERALFEQLEPRILMSATPAPESSDSAVVEASYEHTSTEQQNLIHEMAFIDTSVEGYEDLLSGLNRNVEVVLINSDENGIEKISEVLENREEGVSAIHLIAHGNSGEVYLGNSLLSNSTIESYNERLESWRSSLTEAADILIYGCNVGENYSFIQQLSEKTGADVAASDDVTGVGGDADFEVHVGDIDQQSLLQQQSFSKAGVSLAANDSVANEIDFEDEYGAAYAIDAEAAIKQAFADADYGDSIVFSGQDFTFNLSSQILIEDKVVNLRADGVQVTFDGDTDSNGTNDTRLLYYDLTVQDDVTISGITFQNGTTVGSPGGNGGALYFLNVNLTLTDVTVKNSFAVVNGGGVYHQAGTLDINNSTITDNSVSRSSHTNGGGLYFNGAAVDIQDSNFTNNSAESTGASRDARGGGIYLRSSSTINLENNEISGNTTDAADLMQGGGIYLRSDFAKTLTNNNIFNNISTSGTNNSQGGGIYIIGDGETTLTNNTIYSNSITASNTNKNAHGGGVLITGNATKTLIGNYIYGNSASNDNNAHGGGIYIIGDGDKTLIANSISGNQLTNTDGHSFGGGIYLADNNGIKLLINNTISGNTINSAKNAYGGGLYTNNPNVLVLHYNSILENNIAGGSTVRGSGVWARDNAVELVGNIIHLNTGGSTQYRDQQNVTETGGYNLIGASSRLSTLPNDVDASPYTSLNDLGLSTVQEDGYVKYYSMAYDSALRDKGQASGTERSEAGQDQLGNNVDGDFRDIGAFEYQNLIPTASFAEVRTAGQSYQFTATAADSDGTVVLYEWDFDNDGIYESSSATNNFNYDFPSGGDYIVNLRITDDRGSTAVISQLVSVPYIPVISGLDLTADFINENDSASLIVSFTDSDSVDSFTVIIDWGDGTTTNGVINSGDIFDHQYTVGGDYTILVTVTDSFGLNVLETTDIMVDPPSQPILNDLVLSSSTIDVGELVDLSVLFSESDLGDSHIVSIDWGDGNVETLDLLSGDSFSHQYITSGSFHIDVTVTDRTGLTANSSVSVSVNSNYVDPVDNARFDSIVNEVQSISVSQPVQEIVYRNNSLTFVAGESTIQFNNVSLSEDALGVIATLFNSNVTTVNEVADEGNGLEITADLQIYDISRLTPAEQSLIEDLASEFIEKVKETQEEEKEETYDSSEAALQETSQKSLMEGTITQSYLDSSISLEDTLLGEFDCFKA
ncbi:MAG: DUF4347 domain-containing protein [Lentisphaerales bacterium]|nr:DUF4347 domain-containing protein [Lentisphaerales bacterium]